MDRSLVPDADLVTRLKERCDEAGGQRKLGNQIGFSCQHLSDVLNGRRVVTQRLGEALGYQLIHGWIERKTK